MAVGYNPRAITDGLVLALDAGNPKNYNAGISTNWTDKVGGNNGTLVNGTYHNDGPFVGAGYVEFDGTGDYLSLTSSSDWDLGSGDFTIEFWAYFNDVTTAQKTLITRRNALSNYAPYYLGCDTSSRITFYASSNGSSYDVANNLTFGSLTTNRWYHIALVRNGSQFTGYIDGTGTSLLTSSATLYNNSQSLVVGAETDPTLEHDGFISNLRILKGTALYTSDFTPPTKSLTAVTNTVLLTCQGNTIADASSSGHSISVTGNAAANLGSPASAFVFDGSNYDYILSAANPTLNWGTGDFTVELWVNVSSSSTFGKLFSTEVNAQEEEENTFVISMNGSLQLSVTTYSTVLISASSATAISANTWTHIVVTRQGTTLTLYIDKSSAGTATSSINYVAGGYTTGALPRSLTNTNWSGKISNIKAYKGKALTVEEIEQNYNATKGRYA